MRYARTLGCRRVESGREPVSDTPQDVGWRGSPWLLSGVGFRVREAIDTVTPAARTEKACYQPDTWGRAWHNGGHARYCHIELLLSPGSRLYQQKLGQFSPYSHSSFILGTVKSGQNATTAGTRPGTHRIEVTNYTSRRSAAHRDSS